MNHIIKIPCIRYYIDVYYGKANALELFTVIPMIWRNRFVPNNIAIDYAARTFLEAKVAIHYIKQLIRWDNLLEAKGLDRDMSLILWGWTFLSMYLSILNMPDTH